MKPRFLCHTAVSLLMLSAPLMAADPTPLTDNLRLHAMLKVEGAEPLVVDTMLSPGAMETLSFGQSYALEVTMPHNDVIMGEVRLLKQEGDKQRLLHTARKPWRGDGWPTLGYLVCEDRVSYLDVQEGRELPEC